MMVTPQTKHIYSQKVPARRSHISIPLYHCVGFFLTEAIRTGYDIQGIHIFEHQFKISQYADVTFLYIQPYEKYFYESIKPLSSSSQFSSLMTNTEKTKM